MSQNTPYLGIPYDFQIGEAPGKVGEDNTRLAIDAAALKAFAQNVFGTGGLVYAYLGGVTWIAGAAAQVAGGTLALTPSANNYIERTSAGLVSKNTTGFTAGKIPMALVATSATGITSIIDYRPSFDLASGGGSAWGAIVGMLSDQTDLQAALDAKSPTTHSHTDVYEAAITAGTSTQVWKGNKVWGTVAWGELSGVPSTFAPSAHASAHEPGGADALPWATIHGRGTTAAKPAAAAGNTGYLYFDTTLGKLQRSSGTAWEDVAEAGGASSAVWGTISGLLSDQTDLQAALDAKSPTTHSHTDVYEAAITAGTSTQVWKGNKVWGTVAWGELSGVPSTFAPSAHASAHEPGGADALPWATIHGRGTTAAKPAAAAGNTGYLYFDTTLGKLQRSSGTAWEDVAEAGGSGSAHASAHESGGADALSWSTIHGRGTTAAKPAAAAGNAGYLYFDTDLGKLQRSNGTAWEDMSEAALAGAIFTGPVKLASTAAGAGLEIPSGVPTTVTDKIYNDGGFPKFSGVPFLLSNPRSTNSTSPSSITPNVDAYDLVAATSLAGALTINNPSGTPGHGQTLVLELLDNGTARALTWGTYYRNGGTALPTTTVAGKFLRVWLIYNAFYTKWDCVRTAQVA
jgi:hypothetical protein